MTHAQHDPGRESPPGSDPTAPRFTANVPLSQQGAAPAVPPFPANVPLAHQAAARAAHHAAALPPAHIANVTSTVDAERCAVAGCARPRYRMLDGTLMECCGQTHGMQLAQQRALDGQHTPLWPVHISAMETLAAAAAVEVAGSLLNHAPMLINTRARHHPQPHHMGC